MSGDRAAWRSAFPTRREIAIGLVASGAIGALAYRRGALSEGGVAGAIITGTTIFAAGGAVPSALLITFFVSSSALSHWRRGRKERVEVEAAKGARRDLAQTLANGGVATGLVVLGRIDPAGPWLSALVGALATVNADTWATELGLLNRQPPRLITTLRPVPPGTSGGISPLGTAASALGALTIGSVAALGSYRGGEAGRLLPIGLLAGVGGALVDSFLGATVQARYRCPYCDLPTEGRRHRCGTLSVHVGGCRAVGNDMVNVLASLGGALIGAWIAHRFRR